jgi:8-oxo-dGTP pyrophosphatase MutT (NUDIX family)
MTVRTYVPGSGRARREPGWTVAAAMAAAVTLVRPGEAAPSSFERSVFLTCACGAPWEAEALSQLEAAGMQTGTVFVGDDAPENAAWREEAVKISDAIACWATDASSDVLQATVLRWGSSGKLLLGHAEGSWATPLSTPFPQLAAQPDLPGLVAAVWKMVKAGAARTGAEREVPLMIWRTPPWGLWYESQLAAGNRLDGAKVEWTFRVGPGGAFVLFWAIHADIHVTAEGRNKSNEVVIARPDVCCTLAYTPGPHMLDTEIIVIKEYRSPVRNESGFVYELPGGSSFKPNTDVYKTAADELFEETGIRVDKSRLKKEKSRQAAATVTTHHVHLFSCKLSAAEMDVARKVAEEKTMFGNEHETERTYIEIMTLREALPAAKVDFTTLGMVMQTIGLLYDHDDSSSELDAAAGSPVAVQELLQSKDDALAEKVCRSHPATPVAHHLLLLLCNGPIACRAHSL